MKYPVFQEQEKQRGWLVEALCRRGAALCRLHALAASAAARDKIADALRSNYSDVLRLADLTDPKVGQYAVWQCVALEAWGRAARLLLRLQEDKPSRELDTRLAAAYRRLGWPALAAFVTGALPAKYPASYRPF